MKFKVFVLFYIIVLLSWGKLVEIEENIVCVFCLSKVINVQYMYNYEADL